MRRYSEARTHPGSIVAALLFAVVADRFAHHPFPGTCPQPAAFHGPGEMEQRMRVLTWAVVTEFGFTALLFGARPPRSKDGWMFFGRNGSKTALWRPFFGLADQMVGRHSLVEIIMDRSRESPPFRRNHGSPIVSTRVLQHNPSKAEAPEWSAAVFRSDPLNRRGSNANLLSDL